MFFGRPAFFLRFFVDFRWFLSIFGVFYCARSVRFFSRDAHSAFLSNFRPHDPHYTSPSTRYTRCRHVAIFLQFLPRHDFWSFFSFAPHWKIYAFSTCAVFVLRTRFGIDFRCFWAPFSHQKPSKMSQNGFRQGTPKNINFRYLFFMISIDFGSPGDPKTGLKRKF